MVKYLIGCDKRCGSSTHGCDGKYILDTQIGVFYYNHRTGHMDNCISKQCDVTFGRNLEIIGKNLESLTQKLNNVCETK